MGPQFFETGMGRKFYEGTMPSLVRELGELNKNLAGLLTFLKERFPLSEQVSEPTETPAKK